MCPILECQDYRAPPPRRGIVKVVHNEQLTMTMTADRAARIVEAIHNGTYDALKAAGKL